MITRKVRCDCRAFCSQNPHGYCLIDRRERRKHLSGQQGDIPNGNAMTTNHTSERVASISAEYTHYSKSLIPFKGRCRKLPEKVDLTHISLREILLGVDSTNQLYLDYEEWHKLSLHKLYQTSPTHTDAEFVSQLRSDIITLYSRVKLQALASITQRFNKDGMIDPETLSSHAENPHLEQEVTSGIRKFKYTANLRFVPIDSLDTSEKWYHRKTSHGTAGLILDHGHSESRVVIEHLKWVDGNIYNLEHKPQFHIPIGRQRELLEGLQEHRRNIVAYIESQKISHIHASINVSVIIQKIHFPFLFYSPSVILTALMILGLRLVYGLPVRRLATFTKWFCANVSIYGINEVTVGQLIRDTKNLQKIIGMDVEEELYAICPLCASAYRLASDGSLRRFWCISTRTKSGRKCGGKLWLGKIKEPAKGKLRPAQIFRRRTLTNWLQGLLARPGIIAAVDRAWDSSRGPPHDPATDFWGGSLIRQLRGPDGQTLFSDIPVGETRLLFSLSVDWFNPFHNKTSGRKASTGVILMTCLNLPLEIRNKEENIYLVGTMPGGKEATRIEDFIQPLVDELLGFWHSGVYFFGIPSVEGGRLIRCALVQLVCDLPAARKVAGFPAHSSHYGCSICFAFISKKSRWWLNKDPIPLRTNENHRIHAQRYKDVLSGQGGRQEAEKLLKNNMYGVRWSPLNDLPYWDPIQCTVLDVMHLALLGLCQIHWRRFWHADLIEKAKGCGHGEEEERVNAKNTASLQSDDHQKNVRDGDCVASSNVGERRGQSPSRRTLEGQKMRAARLSWLNHQDNKLSKLTVAQILCLLAENRAEIPTQYAVKAELVQLLQKCRNTYRIGDSLRPIKNPKRVLKRANAVLSPGWKTISPSHALLSSASGVLIPAIKQVRDPKKRQAVLSTDELKEIQDDIKQTILPSWVTKLIPSFGERSHGKPKADEWRSLFSIYLPITLLRLWGRSEPHAGQLKAALTLAVILNILCSHTSSATGNQLLARALTQYLNLISQLFPDESLVITHHLAPHLPMFVELHGPSRTHWAFSGERIIGKLQKIPHNGRIEDIPSTISRGFWSLSTLRALSAHGIQIASLERWSTSLEQARSPKEKPIALEPELKLKFDRLLGKVARWAISLKSIHFGKIVYEQGKSDWSTGNANVGYFLSGAQERYAVGVISQIIKVSSGKDMPEQIFFFIRRFAACNSYSWTQHWHAELSYKVLGIRVVARTWLPEIDIVSADSMLGHVAICPFDGECGPALITLPLAQDMESRIPLLEQDLAFVNDPTQTNCGA